MDARANAAPGAVSVVVSIFKVSRNSVLGRQESAAFIPVRIEDIGAGKAEGIVMKAPYVQNYSASFRNEHIVAGVIWTGVSVC